MEIGQHNTGSLKVKLKFLEFNGNKHNILKSMGYNKGSTKRKIYTSKYLHRKFRGSPNKQLNDVHLLRLWKTKKKHNRMDERNNQR